MEEFKQYITQNWPVIIEYAMMIVAYFLFFLYRSKVTGTKRDLNVMFKEKTGEVTITNENLKKDVNNAKMIMHKELEEAKIQYQAAIDKIATLEKNFSRLNDTLSELFKDDVVEVENGESEQTNSCEEN